MNWCSIKHKWEYKKEDIIYKRINTEYFSFPLKTEVPIPTKVRLCTRCYKKQRTGIRGYYWIDWYLTPEEERDIKLNKILI